MRILVFGPSGMLGHEMVRVLRDSSLEVHTAGRVTADILFDAEEADFSDTRFEGFDYFVNCIGLISHNIDESDPSKVLEAKRINSQFPELLEKFAAKSQAKVIQIATDCVFSGSMGGYLETDSHDATDVYGKTKSAGEIRSKSVMNIRSSIVGRELKGKKSLLEWVYGQPESTTVPGFNDRLWNGVTTTAFARVVAGIILTGSFRPGVWHLVPSGRVTKAELVELIALALGRDDLQVLRVDSGIYKDLTLSTKYPEFNATLWKNAGYAAVPTIGKLINEIAS